MTATARAARIDPREAAEVRTWLKDADDLRYRAAQAMEAWYHRGSTQRDIAVAVGITQASVSHHLAALRKSTCREDFGDMLHEVENPDRTSARPEPEPAPELPTAPVGTDKSTYKAEQPSASESEGPTETEPEPTGTVVPFRRDPDGPTCDPYNHFESLAHELLRFEQMHEQQASWAAKPRHVKAIKARLKRVAKIMESY